VLSDKIIATKAFHVINLRGLSVPYAAPEAFKNFRSKIYVGADFKKYDIYSLACVIYETVSRRSPWD
jgi:serine/threonine protein kinase